MVGFRAALITAGVCTLALLAPGAPSRAVRVSTLAGARLAATSTADSTDPAPTDAPNVDALPTEAPPTDPAPTTPAPTDVVPTEVLTTDTLPPDPAPVVSAPAPTEAPPTDPAPTDPAPTEALPTYASNVASSAKPSPTQLSPAKPSSAKPSLTEALPTDTTATTDRSHVADDTVAKRVSMPRYSIVVAETPPSASVDISGSIFSPLALATPWSLFFPKQATVAPWIVLLILAFILRATVGAWARDVRRRRAGSSS